MDLALQASHQLSGQRVGVDVNSSAARWFGAVALLSVFCWLVVLTAHDGDHADWRAGGRLAWSLAILAAVAFIARGIYHGRPVTVAHASAAAAVVCFGIGAHILFSDLLGNVLVAGAGLVLMWPTTAPAEPDALPRVWTLVDATTEDPLAPFAMQSLKSYHFNPDGTAAIAYRTRAGFAVISGDPIGDATQFPALAADFAAACRGRGWRVLVLGCSQRRLQLWSDATIVGRPLRAVPIGRDIVIEVSTFDMVGRKYRNLRRAVQRTHNAGVTTQVVAEQELGDALRGQLGEVLRPAHNGSHGERRFSMIIDGALQGGYPGIQLIIARDRSGRVQGFHRYASGGSGRDVTLDVPWRRPGAPNGIDERLSVDMIGSARSHGALRFSLAFMPFPEIFEDRNRSRIQSIFYSVIHLGDSLIASESLYCYLDKFHGLGNRRYVLLSMRDLVSALFVLLSLEFMPRRRHLQRRSTIPGDTTITPRTHVKQRPFTLRWWRAPAAPAVPQTATSEVPGSSTEER